MKTTAELEKCFFSELAQYNSTNFKTLESADVTKDDAKVHKCYSSVITRYFIFREKHSELSDSELNMLYFKLKLDLIANYFANYPDSDVTTLVAFQKELQNYVELTKQEAKENAKIHRSIKEEAPNAEVQNLLVE